jgi:uncharacterized RDD family membrane protein YckC
MGMDYCSACGKPVGPGVRQYAGFWMRFVAWVIDSVILGTLLFAMAILVNDPVPMLGVEMIFTFVYIVGFWLAEGATPGKLAMGIRIEMADGRPLTVTAAIFRFFGYIVAAIPFLLGFLMIGVTREKRGLHDYIANTTVISDH